MNIEPLRDELNAAIDSFPTSCLERYQDELRALLATTTAQISRLRRAAVLAGGYGAPNGRSIQEFGKPLDATSREKVRQKIESILLELKASGFYTQDGADPSETDLADYAREALAILI